VLLVCLILPCIRLNEGGKDVSIGTRIIKRMVKIKSGIDRYRWFEYSWSHPTREEAYNHIRKDLKKGV
jgi:hypothetical protein